MNLPELLPKCLAYAVLCVSIFCLWNNRVDIYYLKCTQLSFTQQLLFLLIFDGQQTYKHTIYAVSYVNLL